MAQLIKQSPPKPEIRGSNPDISKTVLIIVFHCDCNLKRKDKNKWKKRPEMALKKQPDSPSEN